MNQNKKYCLNCGVDLTGESNLTKLGVQTTVNSTCLQGNDVSVQDKLSYVFHVEINEVKERNLCTSCGLSLSELYNSKLKFLRLTNAKSTIHNLSNISDYVEILKKEPFDDGSNGLFTTDTPEEENEQSQQILPDDFVTGENHNILQNSELTSSKADYQELNLLVITKKMPDSIYQNALAKMKSQNYYCNLNVSTSHQCSSCERKFLSERHLSNHFKCIHQPVEKPFSCKRCSKRFSVKWFSINHYNFCQNNLSIAYSCQICKEKFTEKNSLEEHKLEKHDIRKYPLKCNNCTESYVNISDLRKHLLVNHKGSVEANAAALNTKYLQEMKRGKSKCCPICQKPFNEVHLVRIRKHMRLKHGVTNIICPICQTMFNNLKDRSEHYKSHRKCGDCNKEFQKIYKLKRHLMQVHGREERYFKCELCGLFIVTSERLSNHYRHHVELAGPRHYCNICNKSYQLKGSLKGHLSRSHSSSDSNQSKYKCEYENCNASFKYKFVLSNHLNKVHNVEMSHFCKICKKGFIDQKSLDVHHIRVHQAETKFENAKRFKETTYVPYFNAKIETTSCFSSESLKFKCPVCEKTCEYKTHFERHLKTHKISYYTDTFLEQQLPIVLKCKDPECQKHFSRVDNMLKHFKKYHDSNSKQFLPTYSVCSVCKIEINNVHLEQHCRRHFTKIIRQNQPMKDLNAFYDDKQKLFECSVCQKKYPFEAQEDFLEHHISEHKSKVVINRKLIGDFKIQFACPTCGKMHKTERLLRKHQEKVHVSRDKWTKCPKCSRAFKLKGDMSRHMRLVHRDKK